MERYVLGQDFNCKDWFVYDNETDTYVCRDTKENCEKYKEAVQMEKRIEQLEAELKWKEEQLEEARKALHGTVEAEGILDTIYIPEGIRERWEINVSDILTKLIKEVGRLCDSYASDLFIHWNEIQRKLNNGTMRNDRYVFGIRDSGVDHVAWYENHKDEHNYYRAVWFLDVETTDKKIKMTLHK